MTPESLSACHNDAALTRRPFVSASVSMHILWWSCTVSASTLWILLGGGGRGANVLDVLYF